MSISINQIRDFSSLFSRSEVIRLLKNDFASFDIKLKRYNLVEKNKGNSYLNVLRKTYKVLEKNYPNEYILKNGLINQWLIDELGSSNSVIFNEFRIGNAIADLAMFNGVSKAFEIKTLLDKEYRLSNQLTEYKKVFNEIYIVVPKELLSKYICYDNTIGLIIYDSEINKFEKIRESQINKEIDLTVLMNILHTKEYKNIVKDYYQDFPSMNAFNQFDICKNLISKIPNEELNKLFIETIKKRNINNSFSKKSYKEFNQVCLSLNLKAQEKDMLINNLKTNII